ncbi:hypothetical protein [Orbus mooreae]|uniref:hypothetical protein n=1 Tax=Orbus mooreae TaxID=3074107 RepID=UPI00370D4E23
MPNISMSTVNLINNKLNQAEAITLLIQGNSTSESPLIESHIDNALMAVADLIECSNEALNDDIASARGKK